MSEPMGQPARLLLCIVGRSRGEALVTVAKAAGARGGTLARAHSRGDNRILNALSLADIPQDVVFLVLGEEADAVIAAIRAAAAEAPKKFDGAAVLLPVPAFYPRLPVDGAGAAPALATPGSVAMSDADQRLVIAIVNAGHADDVMAAARKAGAAGGTILGARGTGTEEDVKFFGITLVPEKEMLLVACPEEQASAIVKAIGEVPELAAPGGGIAFTLPVDAFIPLGRAAE